MNSPFLSLLIYHLATYQLKDDCGQLVGVDTSNLLVANSGNDLPVRYMQIYMFKLVEWIHRFFILFLLVMGKEFFLFFCFLEGH